MMYYPKQDGPITALFPYRTITVLRPEESYRLWCVVKCNLETSRMRQCPTGGAVQAKTNKQTNKQTITVHTQRQYDCLRELYFPTYLIH
jgi:hypothetical protein